MRLIKLANRVHIGMIPIKDTHCGKRMLTPRSMRVGYRTHGPSSLTAAFRCIVIYAL
jgi:hypothetical protein